MEEQPKMVDSNETQKPDTAKILDELSKGRAPHKTRAQKKARSRVVILTLLLLPLALVVAWLAWQQWLLSTTLPRLESRVSDVETRGAAAPAVGLDTALDEMRQQLQRELEDALAAIPSPGENQTERESRLVELATDAAREAIQALSGEIDARLQQQAGTESEIARLRNQVAELSARLRASAASPTREWRLLEAEYLLSMASRKLRFERDVHSAIELYGLADEALAASASDEVYPLRQALVQELASLRSVELPDRDSLFLRLDILLAQADGLRLVGHSIETLRNEFGAAAAATPAVARESVPGDEALTLQRVYRDALDFLSSVFVWRELDEPAQSLVASRGAGAREFTLMLEQAKLALLAQDAILFDRQLQSADGWLRQHGEQGTEAVASALSEIATLRAIDLRPPLPVLGEALRGLSQLNASAGQ